MLQGSIKGVFALVQFQYHTSSFLDWRCRLEEEEMSEGEGISKELPGLDRLLCADTTDMKHPVVEKEKR